MRYTRGMKYFFMIVVLLMSTFAARASDVLYYSGTARLIHLPSGAESHQKLVVVKTLDPSKKMISEIACFVGRDGQVNVQPVYMKVLDERTLQISDEENGQSRFLSGTGEVFGEAWKWNLLKFDMQITVPQFPGANSRVIDINTITDAGVLVARKQIYSANGQLIQLYEGEFSPVSLDELDRAADELGCPSGWH